MKKTLDINRILGKLETIKGKRCFNKDLAREIDVSPMSVSNWTTGKTEPSGSTVLKIANLIGEKNINNLYK